jgi:hypothetical protein
MALASACVPSIFTDNASLASRASLRDGPLTVERALVVDAAAPALLVVRFAVGFFVGMVVLRLRSSERVPR